MNVALVILAGSVAALVGLVIFLAVQWRNTNNRAWARSDDAHDVDKRLTKVEGLHEKALETLATLKSDNIRLEAALREAQDSYSELATQSIDDATSPKTASVLAHALRRLDRVRNLELPKVPGASSTESGGGEEAVHGQDPADPSES